jgi:hypothetical protein
MLAYNTDACVSGVSVATKKSNQLNPDGSWLAIRKNPHVTYAGSELDIQPSCWYIMWTVIRATAVLAI